MAGGKACFREPRGLRPKALVLGSGPNALEVAITESDRRPAAAVSGALVAKIRDLGLQPFRAPEPLPPIGEDEIHLVCWMGVYTA
ncbi:MAG: hypothetical protein RDU83_10185 [bacterium]|nr:hypothetical protein [bacterium]